MKRYKIWAHKISSWKYLTIWRPILPVFPRAQRASFLILTLNSFRVLLKVSSCSSSQFNPCRGRWQGPIGRSHGPSLSFLLWWVNWKAWFLSVLSGAHQHSNALCWLWLGLCTCAVLSHVQLIATAWTVTHQSPLSMRFPRQEYWSGWPFLLQGIFLIQGSNLSLLHLLALADGFFHHWATWKAMDRFRPLLSLTQTCVSLWTTVIAVSAT